MTCPNCGTGISTILRESLRDSDNHYVVKCSTCNLVHIDPVPTLEELIEFNKNSGQDTQTYSDIDDEYQYRIAEIDAKRRYVEVSKVVTDTTRILEIGCGYGNFLEIAKLNGVDALGVELSDRRAAFCRGLGLNIITEPLENVVAEVGKFHIICLFHVVEHLNNPIQFIQLLKTVLTPGGTIFIEVPNYTDIILKHNLSTAYTDFYFQLAHISYYTPQTIKKLVSDSGLKCKVKSVQRYGLNNNMNWILNGSPQLDTPNMVDRTKFNLDTGYAKLLETLLCGDTIWVECY